MEQPKNQFVIYGYKEHEPVHTASGEDGGWTSRYIFPGGIKKNHVILFQLPAYRFIRLADRKPDFLHNS